MRGCGMSIEAALLEIEAQLFVGRRDELALIEGHFGRATAEAAVAYVYGPRGVGKTALLHAAQRAAEQRGLKVLAVVKVAGEGFDGLLRQLARALGLGAFTAEPARVLSAMTPFASVGGLILTIDDYDALGAAEALLRTEFLYRLPPGTTAILTGRLPPAALWPLERAWRSFVERIALQDLPPTDARRLLRLHGIEDPLMQREAHQLTGGRPALLAQVADVLAVESEVAAATEVSFATDAQDTRLQAFILEHLLHPGSRRSAWRPESATGAQELVLLAASLLPYFRRDLLAAMLGEKTAQSGWETLERLPFSLEPGNWYRLNEDLRRRVAALVARERPWLRQVWLRRAVRHLLTEKERRGQLADGLALRLVFEFGEPTAAQTPACAGTLLDGGAAAALAEEFCGAPWLASLAAAVPQNVRVVQTEGAAPIGLALVAPVTDLPAGLMPEGAAPARALVFVLAAKERSAVAPLLSLLAAVARSAPAVVAIGLGAAQGVFERLGLRPIGQATMLLERQTKDAPDWLQDVATRCLGRVDVANVAALAKEALQALAAGRDLAVTQAAAVYRAQEGQGGEPELRRWLLDALASVEIGEPPCCLRKLLRLYYVDKAGSHEDIAELLDMPRATYFRAYREALAAFGAALCGEL